MKPFFVLFVFCPLLIAPIGGCVQETKLDPKTICHPTHPECAALDYDEDGVQNGIDDFPLDSRCATRDDQHCASCVHACEDNQICLSTGICQSTQKEQCNGMDDDFDQRVDEELLAPFYEKQTGVCQGQRLLCQGSQGWIPPILSSIPFYEFFEARCDGLDNDCDGLIDEKLVTTQLAEKQLGVCQGLSQQCLGAEGWVEPDYFLLASYEDIEKSCDSLDNDCDGNIDEFFDLEACDSDLFGRCRAGKKICNAGHWLCQNELNPRAERCDGIDEDCDGIIDEALNDQPLSSGLGLCATLIPQCKPDQGGWIFPTTDQIRGYQAIESLCDGIDNDCDGITDEGVMSGICLVPMAEGSCRFGNKACLDGLEQCVPIDQPMPEDCNALDDDCDALIDEEINQKPAQKQFGVCMGALASCDRNLGWIEPDYQQIPAYSPTVDHCDGLDNDCDGLVDENQSLPEPCLDISQIGECQNGRQHCVMGELICELKTAQAEQCNGLDDDCNGAIDDGLHPPLASLFQGICLNQTKLCRGNAGWQDPIPPIFYESQELSCDGLDNDCDGNTDEALIAPLLSNQLGVCAGQKKQCDSQSRTWIDGDLHRIPAYQSTELCDGLDNDCDGNTDEALGIIACQTQGFGACRIGQLSCEQGSLTCLSLSQPTEEQCNGNDDDCDGKVDENLSLTSTCSAGTGACLSLGIVRCLQGEYRCDAIAKAAGAQELCNGNDDDCDGLIDESLVLSQCYQGIGACIRTQPYQCINGELTCPAIPASPTGEKCDRLDNDCDGFVDEDYQVDLPCVVGLGECFREGYWRCDDQGNQICGNGPGEGSLERCDSLDNDCDGQVDENARTEICDNTDNDCDGRIDENARNEICDRLDNDCDGAIDEQPCVACGHLCPGIQWYSIAGGEYLLGGNGADEQPQKRVRLRAFMLSQEISVLHYGLCVQAGACEAPLQGGGCNDGLAERQNDPINCITWQQARSFATWVGARLPTETQWEYAARSGNYLYSYPWGNTSLSCQLVHFSDPQLGAGCGTLGTAPICSYPNGRSLQGLCDLLGNVQEWVIDDYASDYQLKPANGDPYCIQSDCTPMNSQGTKVVRGLGWRSTNGTNRSRYSFSPLWRSDEIGFRIVKFN